MEKERDRKNLWAPWRIEYILSAKDGRCFLCDLAQDDTTSEHRHMVIARGKAAFAVMNAFPYNSGHLMVAPYAHVRDLPGLDRTVLYEIMDLTVQCEETLRKVMRPDGFNVGFNLGAPAGAGLEDHLHLHIVPRWIGDTNFMPVLDNVRVVPQALKDTAELLRKNWVG